MLETTGKPKRRCAQQEALPLQPPVYVHLGSAAAPTSTPVRAQRSAALPTAQPTERSAALQPAPLQGRGFTAHSQSVVRSLRFTPVAAKQQEHYELNMLGQVRRA